NRHDNRIVLRLGDVVGAELGEVLTDEFQPSGKRVAADDGGAEKAFHDRPVRYPRPAPQRHIGAAGIESGMHSSSLAIIVVFGAFLAPVASAEPISFDSRSAHSGNWSDAQT